VTRDENTDCYDDDNNNNNNNNNNNIQSSLFRCSINRPRATYENSTNFAQDTVYR
jgi:hypothetical protein